VVQDVTEGSPADRAGLHPYDVVVALDDQPIASDDQLIREIAARAPGSAARLRLLRDGREQALTVKLAERPPRDGSETRQDQSRPSDRNRSDIDALPLGLNVRDLDRQTTERLDLPKGTRGVLITRVEPMSSSFDNGIERGTVLLEVNRQRVESVADFRRIARAARPGDILTLWIYAPDLVQRQLKTIRVDDK
jgi:serine protease Do